MKIKLIVELGTICCKAIHEEEEDVSLFSLNITKKKIGLWKYDLCDCVFTNTEENRDIEADGYFEGMEEIQ
jgi:hypothetical protein